MIYMEVIGTPLFQWEVGRQLQIIPFQNMRVNSVHFSNPNDLEALVVKPKEEDGMIVADIPNVLLQSGEKLVVHSVNVSSDCTETLRECIFPVRQRAKPSDYVYTETEVWSYKALENRLTAVEQNGGVPGEPGNDGITPHIGENGNWFIGEEDTGKPSRGEPGKDGVDGEDGYTPVRGTDYWTPNDRNEIVEEVLGQIPEGSSGKAIIDVTELPTENIREDVFYRLLSGSLVINQYVQNMYTIHCVENLPETGHPATNIDQTDGNVYYTVSDGEIWGYVDEILSYGLGIPVGWYPGETLLGALGYGYAGVITNILDDPMDDTFRLLLEYVVYDYKNGNWTSHKKIGWAGTGMSAEVFNHPSNVASGECSHAEGSSSHAEGSSSHAEGSSSHAEGSSSHAEGYGSHAEGYGSHAEGSSSHAEGSSSHAEGSSSHAEGLCSHAEGYGSHAEGYGSHAEGDNSHAVGRSQHVQGEYNIVDPKYDAAIPNIRAKYAHIVGNGTSDADRSNAHTLDWDGNAWFAGYVEGTAMILKSPGGKRFKITVDDSGNLSATATTE